MPPDGVALSSKNAGVFKQTTLFAGQETVGSGLDVNVVVAVFVHPFVDVTRAV